MLAKLFLPFGFMDMSKGEKLNAALFWVVAIFLTWQFVPAGPLFPRPTGTWESLKFLYGNGLVDDVFVSLWRILQASAVSFVIGSLLGYMYNIGCFRPVVVILASGRNIMSGAITAFFLANHITGEKLILWTMAFVITVYFVSGLTQIMDDIIRDEIDHGVTMRMSPWQILWHRVIRNKAYLVYMAFIPCVSMGWSTLAFVEGYSRSRGGIGDRMLQVDKISSNDGIMALVLVSGLLGFGLWFLLRAFGRWKYRWAIERSV